MNLGASARCRELNRDETEGATISILEVSAGWSDHENSLGHGDLEVFLLGGELVFGDGVVGATGSYHRWFSRAGSAAVVRSTGPAVMLVQRAPAAVPPRGGADVVIHTDPVDFQWRGHGEGRNRSEMAVLREDSDTGSQTYALRLPPGWVGRAGQHFHTVSEEAFIVTGDVALEDEPVYTSGSYLFRPPHVVHGARERSETGCFALTWTSGPIDFNYVTVEGPIPVPSDIPRSGGCFGTHSHQIDSENHT